MIAVPAYRPALGADPLALGGDDLRALGLEFGGGFVLPIAHGRVEHAWIVRQAIAALRPTAIAVELPRSLRATVDAALARLPHLSVITYALAAADDDRPGRPRYLVIEPADPLVEALRRGRELGLPIWWIDRDVAAYPAHGDRIPDPVAAEAVGASAYLEHALAAADALAPAAEDHLREATMAQHVAVGIARARAEGSAPRVLVIAGLAHARRLCAAIDAAASAGEGLEGALLLGARGRPEITLHHLSEESSREVLGEMPYVHAAFELARRGEGGPGEQANADATPEPGLAEVVDLFRRRPPGATPKRDVPRDSVDTAPPSPHLAGRLALLFAICREARGRYERSHGGALRPGAIAALLAYACRYARVEGDLAPDLYQLVIAGRGFVDDNYAQELWEVATTYPWQRAAPEIPALDLSLRDLTTRTRNIHLRPRLLRRRRRLMQVVQPRPRERRPGEWAERFSEGICSYPPEDLAIEGFGDQLRRRSTSLVAAADTSTLRFTSTLADGIDVRETIRRWHERTIYVRLDRATRAKAGSVVVIFDDEPLALDELDDDAEPRYPWQMTWQGEGPDEGDMALYATDPFARIVGPGIGRAHYGGFLLSRPAGAMFGVWQDPYLNDARTKAEVLLLAALEHARERIVVYVAAKPPRRQLRQIAARMDRKILHVPLGQLSPITLDRLRVFHVLSGPEVRDEAPRYLR